MLCLLYLANCAWQSDISRRSLHLCMKASIWVKIPWLSSSGSMICSMARVSTTSLYTRFQVIQHLNKQNILCYSYTNINRSEHEKMLYVCKNIVEWELNKCCMSVKKCFSARKAMVKINRRTNWTIWLQKVSFESWL